MQSAKKDLEQASTFLGLQGTDAEEIENNPTHSRAYFEGLYACERAHVERELAVLNEQGAAERAKDFTTLGAILRSAVISNAAYVDLYYGRAMLSRLTGDNAAAYVDLDEAIKCSLEVRKTSAVNIKTARFDFRSFSICLKRRRTGRSRTRPTLARPPRRRMKRWSRRERKVSKI